MGWEINTSQIKSQHNSDVLFWKASATVVNV